MKNKRVETVRKRIAKRKKLLGSSTIATETDVPSNTITTGWIAPIHSSEHLLDLNPGYQMPMAEQKPSPISEWTIFRILASATLVIVLTLIYRTPDPSFKMAKNAVGQVFKKDFQFASVSSWVDENIGDLYSFSPFQKATERKESDQISGSIPVSGRISESFTKNGQGVMVETAIHKAVTAIEGGIVIFAGKDAKHGRTIIIQQTDHTNVWYGQLDTLEVNLYQHIKKGDRLGTLTPIEHTSKGEYYLAVEKGDKFIDPTQVISFD